MFYITRRLLQANLAKLATKTSCENAQYSTNNLTTIFQPPFLVPHESNLQIYRFKGKKNKQKQSSSEGGDNNEDSDVLEVIGDKNTKTLKINVTSLRLDGILKSSLGIARNKVETMFYESKIRMNGEKVLKKSVSVREGDEIDVIRGVNVNNPEFLTVARVEILGATAHEDNITLKIRKTKSLTIDNYKDKWSP